MIRVMPRFNFGKDYRVVPWSDLKKEHPTWLCSAALATAATQVALKGRIEHAFEPLIEFVQGVSYPITFLAILSGMLLITCGKRARGIDVIKWAVVGYLGIQLAPGIMRILAEVGAAMRMP